MKHLFIILCTCSLLSGCSFFSDYDYDMKIIVDRTDPLHVRPDADAILSTTGIDNNIGFGLRISICDVSNRDIPTERVFILPREISLFGNPEIRGGKIAKFKKELAEYLDSLSKQNSQMLTHSIIWRVLANQLNGLEKESAANKYVLIYSDLMENSDITFYSPATLSLLTTNPKAIENELEKECPLGSLRGVKIYCLYLPGTDEENKNFRASSGFFKTVFLDKGASSVTICSALTQ